MNMIVLMKLCADPEKGVMKKEGTVDREKSPPIPNPYDFNALEEALKIKDKQEAKITIIFMGPDKKEAQDMLKNALARGADEAIILADLKLIGSDTRATAYALAQAVKKVGKFDLVICGMQAIDGDTAQVGPQVAEELGIPQITYIKEVVEVKGNEITAKRLIEEGEEMVKTTFPALLTVTNLANEPRFPKLRGVMAAKKKQIIVWKAKDVGIEEKKVGLAGSPTRVKKIQWLTKEKSDCKLVEGKDVSELVASLLEKTKNDGVGLRGVEK